VSENVSKVVVWQRGRRKTFASFSEDELYFSWWAQHFCCVFFAKSVVRAASSGDNVQIPWQVWHGLTCDDTPHSTLHSTLHTSASVKSYQLVKVVSGGRAPGKSSSLASPQLLAIERFHCFGAVRLEKVQCVYCVDF